MPDVALAIIVASLSSLGSWLVQVYMARTTRRDSYDEKRLMALLDVRQAVEQAGGRWYGWASMRLGDEDPEACASFKEMAGQATHDAWYATRVFEMYFPTMMSESQLMRDEVTRLRDLASYQVEVTKIFDKTAFSELRTISLDDVVKKARGILGYPER
jgi:hypothetical protein